MKPIAQSIKHLARKLKYIWISLYASLMGGWWNKCPSINRVLIVPPASPGSLGDDAMVSSLCQELSARGVRSIQIATWAETDRWNVGVSDSDYVSLPIKEVREWTRFIHVLKKVDAVWVIGADMLDGYYSVSSSTRLLRVADTAARMGLMSCIVGSSCRAEPSKPVMRYMKSMSPRVSIMARDSFSKARLDVIRGLDSPLVADIAFLLRVRGDNCGDSANRILSWIDAQRAAGCQIIVGCNVNLLPYCGNQSAITSLIENYRDALRSLEETHGAIGVIMIPHDRRGPKSDVVGLRQLVESLGKSVAVNADLLSSVIDAADTKSIAARCDVIITGRMHLGIASMGSGVPAICVGYQDKMEGMYKHFGLEGWVLDYKLALNPGLLVSLVNKLAEQRSELGAAIALNLPRVLQQSRFNVACVMADPISIRDVSNEIMGMGLG